MLDFLKLCRDFNVPLAPSSNTHVRDRWIQVQCYSCGPRGSHGGWYLGFSIDSGAFSCYRCGALKFWDALAGILNKKEPRELRQIVAQYQTGQTPVRVPITRQKTLKPPPGLLPMAAIHRRYLTGRGFQPEELEKVWEIAGCGAANGGWSWRIVAPVKNPEERIVAYQGRAIGTAEPKYKFTDHDMCLEDPHGMLYGIHLCKQREAVIIVEGITGAWRMGPGTVGTFGIRWHRPQANLLREFKNRYILFDDGDNEKQAKQQARKLAEHLSLFSGNTEILSGFKTDPGDFTPQQAAKIRRRIRV